MRLSLWLLALAACSDLRTHTRAFVATTKCGQGPYEVTMRIDGKSGREGVAVVACTPRRIAGHVEVSVAGMALEEKAFGDVADNARCVSGDARVVATAGAGAGSGGAAGAGGAGGTAAAPMLVERPYTGGEPQIEDELCKPLGLPAQIITVPTILDRHPDDGISPNAEIRVRIWSDKPNDLEGVVFFLRQVTSTKSIQEVAKEWTEVKPGDNIRLPPPHVEPDHHAPPPPLVEERPASPVATAAWVPGYWTWTGTAWGWIAGFWRDERVAIPAPRVELPGAPPRAAAVWIGGVWQVQAGNWVWIRGRWR